MNHSEAVQFLLAHQPLTDYVLNDEDVLNQVGEVIQYYQSNPDDNDLPLLFGFVGDTDADGWLDDLELILLDQFSRIALIEQIKSSLVGEHEGVSIWAAWLVCGLDPFEVIDVCKTHFAISCTPSRSILASAIKRAATENDVEWINQLIAQETEVEVRTKLHTGIGKD